MSISAFRLGMLLITFTVLSTMLVGACGGSEPQKLEIPVSVAGETMNPETITVKQGDMVTLKIQTEEAGEYHLHSYDIETDVKPGEVTDLFLVADATGRFRITIHHDESDHEREEEEHGKDEEGEIDIGFLEVRPR